MKHVDSSAHTHKGREKNTISKLTGLPSSTNISAIVPDWSACHQEMKIINILEDQVSG